MSADPLAVGGEETVRDAAARMMEREVMGALVRPEGGERSPGIITARDVLELVAAGGDPAATSVRERHTAEARSADPGWSLERAAETMIEGRFRHLVVIEDGETAGVVSIRDIVRCWLAERGSRRMVEIREAVNRGVPTLDAGRTLRQAAEEMAGQPVGAAIVEGVHPRRPDLFTEAEALAMVAAGHDPTAEPIGRHPSRRMTYSAPDWSLRQAADAMIRGRFQHVLVVDQHETVGILSMRDVLRRWLD